MCDKSLQSTRRAQQYILTEKYMKNTQKIWEEGSSNRVVAVNSPIKDIKIIEQIKELYKKKGAIRDLLLFTLAINTGINLLDLLKLNIGDARGKFYLNFVQSRLRRFSFFIIYPFIQRRFIALQKVP